MLTASISGLFGLIIGSFLNVVILRRGAKSLGGRSMCFSCGNEIAWYDNVPLISYLALRGRCRACGSGISIQYPLVEAATALLFGVLGAWASAQPDSLVLRALVLDYFAIASILVALFAYDVRHTIIPDAWAYLFALLSFLTYPLAHLGAGSIATYLLAGPLAALPLFALWLVSRGRWMGLGDSKLALGMGWLLGPVYGVVAVFFAFMIGAVVSLAILLPLPLYRRILATWGLLSAKPGASYTMSSEVPFGPFLIASCLIIWFMLLNQVPLPF